MTGMVTAITNFGGIKGKNHTGLLPTGKMVLFLIVGQYVDKAELYAFV
jgi:hypothetical protein